MAFCPHLNTTNFQTYYDDKFDWHTIMDGDLELLERSDAIVMLPGWEYSTGAKKEHEAAKEMGKQIFYGVDEVPRLN